MEKTQIAITFEHEGRRITVTRFLVGGMIANPIPGADAKRESLRKTEESLKRRKEVCEAEIAYLLKQPSRTKREENRLLAAESDSSFVSDELSELKFQLRTYAPFVALDRFTTGTVTWKLIVPKSATKSRRAA